MQSTPFVIVLDLLLPGVPRDARATAIYPYVGNRFQTAVDRYTTSDSLSGTIEVSSPLAASLSNAAITLEAWSFADGSKVFDAGSAALCAFRAVHARGGKSARAPGGALVRTRGVGVPRLPA